MAPTRSLRVVITGDSRDFDRALKSADKGLARFDVAVGNSAHKTKVFQDSLNLVKPAAMISGVGLAAQAVSTLGAGAVATASALAPLSGALAAYPALAAAAGQGLGVLKLATMGIGEGFKAMLAGGEEWEKWLKGATKSQREFMLQMRPLRAEFKGLQEEAQSTALPRFSEAIQSAMGNMGRLRPIVHDTAAALGDLAVRAGAMAGSDIWGRDLSKVAENNVTTIRRLGSAGLYAATALRDIVVEAQPLVSWMTKGAESFARVAQGQVFAARESGKLAGFFEETRVAMSRVLSIGADLAVAFFNIGKAGKPLGDEILVSLVRVADQFRQWTESARGENAIKTFFEQARPGIFEVGKLVRDVTFAFGKLSAGTQVAPLVAMIRTELLPVLTTLVASTTAAFGPVMVRALSNIVQLFASIGGSSGPLVIFVQLVGGAAGALSKIVNKTPGMQALVVTIAGLAAVIKTVRFVGMITGLTTVIGAVRALRVAYIAETGAQNVSTVAAIRWRVATIASAAGARVAAVATRAYSVAQLALNVAMRLNPIGLVITGLVALGVGLVAAYRKSETFRNIINGAWRAIKSVVVPAAQTIGRIVGTEFGVIYSAASKVASVVRSIGSAISSLASTAKKVGGALNPFGDGEGFGGALPGGAGLAGGSLDGAKPIMSPFVSLAGRFGLHTSSGLRPGAITSSGNASYHGSGNAVDEAGTPAGMLGYFRYLKATFGSRLRELIYTPGGAGIKDGRPYTYTGQVAADHFDHVHVAFTGDGHGRRTGDGIGQAVAAARAAGFRGNALVDAVAIAGAESTYVAGRQNLKYPDHSIGLWQINQLAHHGRFGTDAQLKNPFTNARAAYALWKQSGFRPWSTWPKAAQAFEARARAAVAGRTSSAAGAPLRSGTTSAGRAAAPKGATSGSSYAAQETTDFQFDERSQQHADVLAGVGPYVYDSQGHRVLRVGQGARPLKGGGPSKGLPADFERPEPGPAGPTHDDYIRSNIARARLTEGLQDDVMFTKELRDVLKNAMDAALADLDPRNDQDAIDAYLSAKDAVETLEGTMQANTDALKASEDAMKAHTDALTGVQSELQRQTDVATSIQSTESFQLKRYLAELLSGEMGRGVVRRGFTAGTGVEVAY